uniref:Uncharacterized protein n=1 Tax=Anguilla anguilla TaxID=7936 RepID=A0A0E9XZA0_ANGAN
MIHTSNDYFCNYNNCEFVLVGTIVLLYASRSGIKYI